MRGRERFYRDKYRESLFRTHNLRGAERSGPGGAQRTSKNYRGSRRYAGFRRARKSLWRLPSGAHRIRGGLGPRAVRPLSPEPRLHDARIAVPSRCPARLEWLSAGWMLKGPVLSVASACDRGRGCQTVFSQQFRRMGERGLSLLISGEHAGYLGGPLLPCQVCDPRQC